MDRGMKESSRTIKKKAKGLILGQMVGSTRESGRPGSSMA
eukprot:CAMPEP_0201282688 /NCGR_PEP_ID=MMETSP1317-20130820/6366_1 /ASSEMBLY_ACC=CAM_ASM_000770 /TAXON_ID=187299 /ORGANISM="Undescribed Undescribed, Strain Undescribed" /LENGTH=39 /DNA_ID= /DNA_START= /DNA_END= /DNA_ORIENTATION=